MNTPLSPNSQRGTILRDTQRGDGLLAVAGRQFSFSLEDHWGSDQPPVVGAKVDAQFDASGQLSRIVLVNEAELARELAGQASQHLQQQASVWSTRAKAALGPVALGAWGATLLGWLALDQVSVRVIGTHSVSISMWQALQMMNAPTDLLSAMQGSHAGAGLWGWVMVLALLAPLAPMVWNHRRAQLGLAMPLAFAALQVVRFYAGVQAAVESLQEQTRSVFGQAAAQTAQSMGREVLGMVSQSTTFSAGFYLGMAGALTLAGLGVLRYLARRV